jgi:hypothetical protein
LRVFGWNFSEASENLTEEVERIRERRERGM